MLGLNESTNHLIVCNGYKDEEFMRLALIGQGVEDRSRADIIHVAHHVGVENQTDGLWVGGVDGGGLERYAL
ncbi:MAG: hypothetical protein RIS50_1713, partial [Bacteroidota bacterium]